MLKAFEFVGKCEPFLSKSGAVKSPGNPHASAHWRYVSSILNPHCKLSMKKRYVFCCLCSLIAIVPVTQGTTETDLTVTNTLEVQGYSFFQDIAEFTEIYSSGDVGFKGGAYFGSNISGIPIMGIDTGEEGANFYLLQEQGYFSWSDDGSEGPEYTKMLLDEDNVLLLFDPGTDPREAGVELNPAGDSFFSNDVVMEGTNNSMPNQTVVNGDSVLTKGLADELYASPSGMFHFYDTSGDVPGNDTFFIDFNNSLGPDGHRGILIGAGNYSNGVSNMAFGEKNILQGNYASALGTENVVTGWHNRAIARDSYVGGGDSLTLNLSTQALGDRSIVAGTYNTIWAGYSATFGRLARDIREDFSWVWSDRLFVLGNGEFLDAEDGNPVLNFTDGEYDASYSSISEVNFRPYARRSDAFVVRKNGSTEIIAHLMAPENSAMLSVMDGSDDPYAPATMFAVDKEGDVSTVGEIASTGPVSAGPGHEYIEVSGEPKPSYVGEYGFNDDATEGQAPMLVVGGGDDELHANAMVVRKDGTVEVGKTLRVPPAGDLAKGEFTAGINPKATLQPAP